MCGIVYVRGANAAGIVAKRYKSQRSRGTEGFGIVEITKAGVVKEAQRFTKEADALKYLATLTKASEILFHHRYPTSTPNYRDAAHPIFVSNKKLKYDYYVIHNGVISNDDLLRDKHLKDGFEYTTEIFTEERVYSKYGDILEQTTFVFNDSEALAIELAIAFDQTPHAPKIDIMGSAAFIVFQIAKDTRKLVARYMGRNYGSPLFSHKRESGALIVSSEGAGVAYEPHKLYRSEFGIDNVTETDFSVGAVYNYSSTGGTRYSGGIYDGYAEEYAGSGYKGFRSGGKAWNFDDEDDYLPLLSKGRQVDITKDRPLVFYSDNTLKKVTDNGLEGYVARLSDYLTKLEADLESIEEDIYQLEGYGVSTENEDIDLAAGLWLESEKYRDEVDLVIKEIDRAENTQLGRMIKQNA